LRAVLDDDAIIVADPGTPCPYVSAYYELRTSGRTLFSNRAHGALGYAMSAAMGVHIGQPDKKVVSLMGDGSFGFTCGELETAVRMKMPITFIVFSNAVFGWIKAGQRAGFGERYYSVDFDRSDHAAIASALGVKSWKVEDPEQLQSVLKQAIDHDGPTLVDVISQPLNEAAAPVSEWIA
jgi:acetolactate synthase-1/2/3 large subunit